MKQDKEKKEVLTIIHQLDATTKEVLLQTHKREDLRAVELPMNDMDTEFLEVAICVPSIAVTAQFMKYMDTNPKKGQEILIKQCLLTNKEQVMNDKYLFLTAVTHISELIPIREGRVKKF